MLFSFMKYEQHMAEKQMQFACLGKMYYRLAKLTVG